MEEVKMKFILELARDVQIVRKRELDKLPYQFNILDECKLNENCNTKILIDLLNFKDGGSLVFLKSFVQRMNLRYGGNPLSADDVNEVSISFNKEYIDGLIEDRNRKFGIIIENKIMDASDQNTQIERYIDAVQNHGVEVNAIYAIYLTKDGSKKVSNISFTDTAKNNLGYKDGSHGRFIEMNYRDDILPWLREDVLNDIKVKDVLLLSTVNLYIDYLENLLHVRKSEKPISEIMQKEIAKNLDINNKSVTDSWNILNDNYNNLDVLKAEIFKMRESLERSVIGSWNSISDNYWPSSNNVISDGYFQLFLGNDVPNNIHFEWMIGIEDLFNSSQLKFELHAESQDKKYCDQLSRNDAFEKEAVRLGFDIIESEKSKWINLVIRKYVELPYGKSFSKLSEVERNLFLKDFYESIQNLKNIVVSSFTLIEDEVEITSELKEVMEKDTKEKWDLWPESDAWDLVKNFNFKSHRIGIESSFSVNDNMEPEYRIYITVWNKDNWDTYEDELKKVFEDAFKRKLDKDHGNRVFLHIPPVSISGERDKWFPEIVKKLKDVYGKMKDITDRIK